MMHRHGAHRLEHAADLRSRAEVDAGADLRARSDQCVGVDHRAFAHVRADVDVHGRAWRLRPWRGRRRRARTSRRERCGRRCWSRSRCGGNVSLSKNGQRPGPSTRPRGAEAEAEQDALLDPAVHPPARWARSLRRGGRTVPSANAARRRAKSCGLVAGRVGAGGPEPLDVLPQGLDAHADVVSASRPSSRAMRAGSAGVARSGRPSEADTCSSNPGSAITAFTGMGLDSTKLACISGSRRLWIRRRRRSRRARRPRQAAPCPGHFVARDGDDALAAQRHHRQRQRVVAREHLEARGHGRRTSVTWKTLPEASFTAMIFGCSASRRRVRCRCCCPCGRARCRGRWAGTASRDGREVLEQPSCVGLL